MTNIAPKLSISTSELSTEYSTSCVNLPRLEYYTASTVGYISYKFSLMQASGGIIEGAQLYACISNITLKGFYARQRYIWQLKTKPVDATRHYISEAIALRLILPVASSEPSSTGCLCCNVYSSVPRPYKGEVPR